MTTQISFVPVVVVTFDDTDQITAVEVDWGDSVNFGDEEVDRLLEEDSDRLDRLTGAFDVWLEDQPDPFNRRSIPS